MTRILIIEDDPLIASVYGSKYGSAGFETSIAEDGERGLELLESFKPDLVHLDLMVPKVNGVEVVKRIRSHPQLKTLPVIVLSNTYQNRLMRAAMAAGATELVSKATCTPRMMLEIVEKLLARADPRPSVAAPSDAAPLGEPEIRSGFLTRAPQILDALRQRISPLLQAETEAARVGEISALSRIAHSFAGHAGVAGFSDLAQISSALVALLAELLDRPAEITDSSLRTIVDACDFLPHLFATSSERPLENPAAIQVLVVDDDAFCRRAVRQALTRLNAATITVDDAPSALRLLQENPFSLIFLDVEMPGMNGFDLCAALRKLPANAETPVVFVTTLDGLESRGRALACGGNDLIAKPFLPMELAVKALSLLRRRPANGAPVTAPGLT